MPPAGTCFALLLAAMLAALHHPFAAGIDLREALAAAAEAARSWLPELHARLNMLSVRTTDRPGQWFFADGIDQRPPQSVRRR